MVGLIPLLAGRMDVQTFLIVSLVGSMVILPVWRQAGETLNSPRAMIGFFQLVVGPVVIGRVFSGLAILTYLGAWGCTLSVMRFVTRWRDRP
ncbi:MAG: hypothetical protein C0498_14025 [Anaerolinea sp.]|jgi:hypothetical protein|nr:hypothetical protein [Anaerolinea sp.]